VRVTLEGIELTISYQALRKALGDQAHSIATLEYESARKDEHLFVHDSLRMPGPPVRRISLRRHGDTMSPARNTLLRKDLDPYLSTLVMALQTRSEPDFPLDPAEPGSSRQPDLASVDRHEIYEIKPDTPQQKAAGIRQLEEFRTLLKRGDANWSSFAGQSARYASPVGKRFAEMKWQLGRDFLPKPAPAVIEPLGPVTIYYYPARAGLIVWRTKADEEKVREAARDLARHTSPLLVPVPPTEEAVEKRAREFLDRNSAVREKVGAFVMQVGVAVAVLALGAAIGFLFVQASLAVAFGLALALCIGSMRGGTAPALRLT
jgi:hypothetical protein